MSATHFISGIMNHAHWLGHGPGLLLAGAVVATALMGGLCWPRGCCKEDSLFSRKAV